MSTASIKLDALIAAFYERVSEDKGGRSVADQHAENLEACEQNGWTPGRTYRSTDRSASRFARRQRDSWAEVIADLNAGRFGGLVLWEVSRASRELEEGAALLNACRRRGVLIHVTSHGRTYDVRNPHDWKQLAEEMVDAAFESEKTSQRVGRTVKSGARAGTPHGRTPYGFERLYDPGTGKLDGQYPKDPEAGYVREIIGRVASGWPVSAVVRDLIDRGIPAPSGGVWSGFTVRGICKNAAYIGKRNYGGVETDATWPAIVDEDVFRAAGAVLADPSRRPDGAQSRPGAARWLLSYAIRCGVCGQPMRAAPERTSAKGKHHGSAYECWEPGRHVSILTELADDYVTDLVRARLARPDFYDALVGPDDAAAAQARAEATALRTDYAEYKELAKARKVTPAAFAEIEAGLLPQLRAAEEREQAAIVPPALRGLAEPGADIAARWEALPIGARKMAVKILFESIRVRPAGHVPVGARMPAEDRIEVVWRVALPSDAPGSAAGAMHAEQAASA